MVEVLLSISLHSCHARNPVKSGRHSINPGGAGFWLPADKVGELEGAGVGRVYTVTGLDSIPMKMGIQSHG